MQSKVFVFFEKWKKWYKFIVKSLHVAMLKKVNTNLLRSLCIFQMLENITLEEMLSILAIFLQVLCD